MNQYKKQVKQKNKYREFIRVLNGALNLTEREIDVLSLLLRIDDEWPSSQSKYKNILSTDSRRQIMKETLINKSNLTKYVKNFKEHGLIQVDDYGNSHINPIFKPEDDKGTFEIHFILNYN